MEKFKEVAEISAKRAEIGQSTKKIANSAQEFTSTPESGVFSHVGTKDFDIPGTGKVTSLGLFTESGEFVSENALNAQDVKSELVEIKNGPNKGKFMLRSERISDLSRHGASADIRLLNLQGRAFTTERVENGRTLKEYTPAKMFAVKNDPANLEKLLKNTDVKRFYRFIVQ